MLASRCTKWMVLRWLPAQTRGWVWLLAPRWPFSCTVLVPQLASCMRCTTRPPSTRSVSMMFLSIVISIAYTYRDIFYIYHHILVYHSIPYIMFPILLLTFVCFHFASTENIRLRCLTDSRRCHMLFTLSGPQISQKMEIPFPFCATINILVDYCFDGEGALLVGIVRACNRQ